MRRRSFIAGDAGSTMVEFAIAAFLFTTVLLGVVDFGYAVWSKNSVASDAKEGARYAMVRGQGSGRVADSASVANYVKTKTGLGSSIVVLTTWTPNKTAGSLVSVKVKKGRVRFAPFLPAAGGRGARGRGRDPSASACA